MRGDLMRQINVRLEQSTIDQINQLIADGEFYSMAEFLRYACNQILKKYEGRSPPPLGMIEGLHRRERNSQDSRRRR